ncbi:MAG: hypothetical protein K2K80_02085 [Clostridia bacterium]|nr:hypothetical protein [Clostridia bacterium]
MKDEGPYSNPAIVFDCTKLPDVIYLIENGYDYVTVTVEFEMREIDDGYQIVYLCPGADEYRVSRVQCNFHGNKTYTKFDSVGLYFQSFHLGDFLRNGELHIALRFDASGAGSDTWQFKNMNIRVEISKEVVRPKGYRTSNIK